MLVRRSHVTDPHVDGVRETEKMSAGVREEVMRLVDSVLASSQVADVPTLLERCLERVRAEHTNAAEDKAQQPTEVTAVDVSKLTAAAAILGQPAPTEVLAVVEDEGSGCPACRGRHRAHTCGQPWKAKKRPSMADEAAAEHAKRLKALGGGIPYAAASALARPLSSNLMASALLSSQMSVHGAADAAASVAAAPPFAGVDMPQAHAQMVAIEDIDD